MSTNNKEPKPNELELRRQQTIDDLGSAAIIGDPNEATDAFGATKEDVADTDERDAEVISQLFLAFDESKELAPPEDIPPEGGSPGYKKSD